MGSLILKKKIEVQTVCVAKYNITLFILGPAVEFGTIPISWFELGISNASLFEVVLVSLALVYYVADMPSGDKRQVGPH